MPVAASSICSAWAKFKMPQVDLPGAPACLDVNLFKMSHPQDACTVNYAINAADLWCCGGQRGLNLLRLREVPPDLRLPAPAPTCSDPIVQAGPHAPSTSAQLPGRFHWLL